jgi:hypothetical protein
MANEKIIKSPEEEYLNSIGIYLDATTLIVHINGRNRQPDLCQLLKDYALNNRYFKQSNDKKNN